MKSLTHIKRPLIFVGPAVLVMAALTIYPAIHAVRLAMFRYNLTRPWVPRRFVGVDNFLSFFSDPYLGNALEVTAKFALSTICLQLLAGFAVAWALTRITAGRTVFRIIFLLPMMVVPVVTGLIWLLMLNDGYGIINWILASCGLPPQLWLGPNLALPSVILAETWQWLPFSILIFSVALSSIPPEYYEAAEVDGAGRRDVFRYITLPNLKWAIGLILVFKLSDAIKAFDVIYSLTGGGPGITTQTLAMYIMKQGFTDFEMGYSAALSLLLLLVSLVIIMPVLNSVGRENQA